MMTLCITIAFLVRSSSLVGWIPLALYKIFKSVDYFMAILSAGLLIALPVFVVSLGFDSLYYGHFTITQLNFVKINVVDNISKYFGIEPWDYYIDDIREHISYAGIIFKL